jgi:hypothetical protein
MGHFMTKSAISLVVDGAYLTGMGIGMIFIPNAALAVLGLPRSIDVWPHVVGCMALVLAFYYICAGLAEVRPFIEWTVYARIAIFLFFTAFVLVGLVRPILMLLGAVDLVGALWTAWALRTERVQRRV